jgi:hypothetical protein
MLHISHSQAPSLFSSSSRVSEGSLQCLLAADVDGRPLRCLPAAAAISALPCFLTSAAMTSYLPSPLLPPFPRFGCTLLLSASTSS